MLDRHRRSPTNRGTRDAAICQAMLGGFEEYLRSRGYAVATIQQYVAVAENFRSWLCHPRKRRQPLDEDSVTAFIRHYKSKHQLRHWHHLRSGLGHLVKMLRDRGDWMDAPAPAPTTIDLAVQEFAAYLRETCGLADSTCGRRAQVIRRFLESRHDGGTLRLNQICHKDLTQFMRDFAKHATPASSRELATSLRKYLRFLQLQGICDERLLAAIPRFPSWKLASLPRTMTDEQVCKFLSSFDRSTPAGQRNYGIALLMATLGLRASEVALLQLDDLNWRESSLRVTSPKSRRAKVLPMPACVGQAIADYLRHGRPTVSHRYVFARHTAPQEVPLNGGSIRAITVLAYGRCGFDPQWKGTHILRHTVATQVHQRGATLKEVADLLGHRSIETSAIYAKVNMPALSAVALPWPEVTT